MLHNFVIQRRPIMYRSKAILNTFLIITVIFYGVAIASGQSPTKDASTKNATPSLEEKDTPIVKSESAPKDKIPNPKSRLAYLKDKIVAFKDKITSFIPSNSENDGEFDFSTNGDDILQNFFFFLKVPLEIKSYEVSLSGKYHQTFQKKDISSKSEHPSEWETLPHWQPLSKSYSFGLEGSSTRKVLGVFTFGGHIEYERDYSIVMDPHVHVGGFAEFPLFPKWKWMKGGAGLWLEGQQLSTHSPKLRSGLRFHIEIDSKYFNMVIECLPHWDFKEYRANVSPEVVYEFKPFGKKLDLVLHCEIDYYSEKTSQKKTGLTVEPLFDIDPWEIRWTQLFRVPF